jgi:nucleoside-diphosphate-sugar epimerase
VSKRVVFTGGTGKAGRHVVAYLAAHGYEGRCQVSGGESGVAGSRV